MHKRIVDTDKGLGFIIREVRSPKGKREPIYHENPLPPEVIKAIGERRASQKRRIKEAMDAAKIDPKVLDAAAAQFKPDTVLFKQAIAQAMEKAKANVIETDKEYENTEKRKYGIEVKQAGAGFDIESQPEKSKTARFRGLDEVRRKAMENTELLLYKTRLNAKLRTIDYTGTEATSAKAEIEQTFRNDWMSGLDKTVAAEKLKAADAAEHAWYNTASETDKRKADDTRTQRQERDKRQAFASMLNLEIDAEPNDPQTYTQKQSASAVERQQIENFIRSLTILRDKAIKGTEADGIDKKIAAANVAENEWLESATDQHKEWANQTREARIEAERKQLAAAELSTSEEYGPHNIVYKQYDTLIDELKQMFDIPLTSTDAKNLFPIFFYDGRNVDKDIIANKEQVLEVHEMFKTLLLQHQSAFESDQYVNQLLSFIDQKDTTDVNEVSEQINAIIANLTKYKKTFFNRNNLNKAVDQGQLTIDKDDINGLIKLMVNNNYATEVFEIVSDDRLTNDVINRFVAGGALIKTDISDRSIYEFDKGVNVATAIVADFVNQGTIKKVYRLQQTQPIVSSKSTPFASKLNRTLADIGDLKDQQKIAVDNKETTITNELEQRIQALAGNLPGRNEYWSENADDVLIKWQIPPNTAKLNSIAAKKARVAAAKSVEAAIDSARDYATTKTVTGDYTRKQLIDDEQKAEKPPEELVNGNALESILPLFYQSSREKTPEIADLPSAKAQDEIQALYKLPETTKIELTNDRGSVGHVLKRAGVSDLTINLTPYNALCKKIFDLHQITDITEKKNKFIALANGFLDFMNKYATGHSKTIKQLKSIENSRMRISGLLDIGDDLTFVTAANAKLSEASAKLVGLSKIYGSSVTTVADANKEIETLSTSLSELRRQITAHSNDLDAADRIVKTSPKKSGASELDKIDANDIAENAKQQIAALSEEVLELEKQIDGLKSTVSEHDEAAKQLAELQKRREQTFDFDENIQKQLLEALTRFDLEITTLPEYLKAALNASEIFAQPKRFLNRETGSIDPLLPTKDREEMLIMLDPARAARRIKELKNLINTTTDDKQRAEYEKQLRRLEFRETGAAAEIGERRAEIEQEEDVDNPELWRKRRQLKTVQSQSIDFKGTLKQIKGFQAHKNDLETQLKQSSNKKERDAIKADIVDIDAKIKARTNKLDGVDLEQIKKYFETEQRIDNLKSELEQTSDQTKRATISQQIAAADKDLADSQSGIRSGAAVEGRGPVGEALQALYLQYATPLPTLLLPIGPAYKKTTKIRIKGLVSLMQLMHQALTSSDENAINLIMHAVGSTSKIASYSNAAMQNKTIDGDSIKNIDKANRLARQHAQVHRAGGRHAVSKNRAFAQTQSKGELEKKFGSETAELLINANVSTIGELFNFLGANKYRVVGSDARNLRKDQRFGYFQRLIDYQKDVRRKLVKVLDKRYGVGNWVEAFNKLMGTGLGTLKLTDKHGKFKKAPYRLMSGQEQSITDLDGNEQINTLDDLAQQSIKNRTKLQAEQDEIGSVHINGKLYDLWHNPPEKWAVWKANDLNKPQDRRQLYKSHDDYRSLAGNDIFDTGQDRPEDEPDAAEWAPDAAERKQWATAYNNIIESPAEYSPWKGGLRDVKNWLAENLRKFGNFRADEFGDWEKKVEELTDLKDIILNELAELREDIDTIQNEFVGEISGKDLNKLLLNRDNFNRSIRAKATEIEKLEQLEKPTEIDESKLKQLNSTNQQLTNRMKKIDSELGKLTITNDHIERLNYFQLEINKKQVKLHEINKQLKRFRPNLFVILGKLSIKHKDKEIEFKELALRCRFAELVIDTIKPLINKSKSIETKLDPYGADINRQQMMENDIRYLMGDESGVWQPYSRDEKGNKFSSSFTSLKPQNMRARGLMPTADGSSGFWGKVSQYDPNHRFISNKEIKRLTAEQIVSSVIVQFVQIISDITLYLRGFSVLNINGTGSKTNTKWKSVLRKAVGGRGTRFRQGSDELEGLVKSDAWRYIEAYVTGPPAVKAKATENLIGLGSQMLHATAIACHNATAVPEEDYQKNYPKQVENGISLDKIGEFADIFDELAVAAAANEKEVIDVAGTGVDGDKKLFEFDDKILQIVLDRLTDEYSSIDGDVKATENAIRYSEHFDSQSANRDQSIAQKRSLVDSLRAKQTETTSKIAAVKMAINRKKPTVESSIIRGALVIIDNVNDAPFLNGLRGYVSRINQKTKTAIVELFNNNIVADKSVLLDFVEMTPYQ